MIKGQILTLVRSLGMCGRLVNDGTHACIMSIGHDDRSHEEPPSCDDCGGLASVCNCDCGANYCGCQCHVVQEEWAVGSIVAGVITTSPERTTQPLVSPVAPVARPMGIQEAFELLVRIAQSNVGGMVTSGDVQVVVDVMNGKLSVD